MPNSFRILLIDDDPLLKGIIETASKNSFPEATYTQVYSGKEAQQYILGLDGFGPRLIFLDLELKDSASGLDFLTFLRSNTQARLLPIIVLTVHELPNKVKEFYKLGANSFVVKPFDLNGWQAYLAEMRVYWLNTVTIPQVVFSKQAN